MATAGNPTRLRTKTISADTTLTYTDLRNYGHVVADTSSAAIEITLPTPVRWIQGFELYVTNDGASNDVTITCTNGFVQDGDSATCVPGQTIYLQIEQDADEDLRWLYYKSTNETIQDVVGAMFSSNTETGATIAYQDGDGTIDFTLDLDYVGDQVAGMFTGGSHTLIAFTYNDDAPGTIDAVVDEETIQDNIAAMFTGASHTGISATYNDATPDIELALTYPTEWSDISTGLTVTYSEGGAPASVTTVARGCKTGPHTARVVIDLSTADGDDKTPSTITLPTGWIPADVDAKVPCTVIESIGGAAYAAVVAYVEAEDGTEGNRVITLVGATQWADAGAARICVTAEYELPSS